MNKAILAIAALLCAIGILLMLSQRILEWKQDRERSGPPAGRISSRMPHWIDNVGLALIAMGALLASALVIMR